MEIFPLDGLVVHLLDDSVQCQCTICQTRQSVGGLTFILFADEIWTEHLPLEEAECRFKNLNPQMHFDHNTMLENIKCCLKDNKRITEYNRATNVFSVVFRFKVEDIVLSWRLETRRAPYSVVLSHLISPLSLALEESTRRQMLLLDRMLKIRSDSNLHGPQPFSSEVFEDSMNKSPGAFDFQLTSPCGMALSPHAQKLFSAATERLFSPKALPTRSKIRKSSTSTEDLETDSTTEDQRKDELQRKLAKAKTKRNKKSGILRN